MPPLACSIRPARAAAAPVKAPRAWPNSSFSRSESVSAAQFSATNGLSARGLLACTARATSSLPVPVSPVTRTVPGAAAARPIRSFMLRIGSLSPMSVSTGPPALIWRCSRSTWRASPRRSAADANAHQELVAEERLLHEVDGAEFHRLDRRVDGSEPGHHDEGGVDVKRAQPLEHDDAGDPRHPHVRQDDVEDVALRGRDAFLAGGCRLDGEAGAAQHARHAVANALVVVDDKNAGHAA